MSSFDQAEIKPERVHEIPQIAFMMTTMRETGPMLAQVVEQLSATYFVVMRDNLSMQSINTFLLAWS